MPERETARQRILQAANELFYTQGYRATGVSEIIELADVAKATFYSHFASKEALCSEYLDLQNKAELAQIEEVIAAAKTPFERYMAPALLMEPFSSVNDQRGCRFINIAAEIPSSDNVLRKPGIDHYEQLRRLLLGLVSDLKESDPASYQHVHATSVADTYLLLIGGGLVMAELFDQLWPARHIARSVEQLVHPEEIGQSPSAELEAVSDPA